MKQSEFEQRKRVRRFLIPFCKKGRTPGMIKRHVAAVYARVNDQWRLFAEGCLRNRYFHEEVFLRGPRCLACERNFNRKECQVHSKIEKHHNDYLNLCQHTGPLLPADHEDIYRPAVKREHDQVPDCRRCHEETPANFEACLSRIYPVHSSCHERIHDKERHFIKKARADLQSQFSEAARSWVPVDFYLD